MVSVLFYVTLLSTGLQFAYHTHTSSSSKDERAWSDHREQFGVKSSSHAKEVELDLKPPII